MAARSGQLHEEDHLFQGLREISAHADMRGKILPQGRDPVIGTGGYGTVFRATYNQRTPVAVKRLDFDRGLPDHNIAAMTQRLHTESELWARLCHRNVLQFYGLTDAFGGRIPCMVSPFVEGGNIVQYMRRRLELEVDRIALLVEIADGVKYLHDHNISHGDMKGQNILITTIRVGNSYRPRPLLCDFGLAKALEGMENRETTSLRQGTQRFFPPERALNKIGSYKREHRSTIYMKGDVWAWGMTALQIFSGKEPWHKYSDEQVIERMRAKKIPEIKPYTFHNFSKEMYKLLKDCWDYNVFQRPTMEKVLERMKIERAKHSPQAMTAEQDSSARLDPRHMRPPTNQYLPPGGQERGISFYMRASRSYNPETDADPPATHVKDIHEDDFLEIMQHGSGDNWGRARLWRRSGRRPQHEVPAWLPQEMKKKTPEQIAALIPFCFQSTGTHLGKVLKIVEGSIVVITEGERANDGWLSGVVLQDGGIVAFPTSLNKETRPGPMEGRGGTLEWVRVRAPYRVMHYQAIAQQQLPLCAGDVVAVIADHSDVNMYECYFVDSSNPAGKCLVPKQYLEFL